MSRGRHWSMAGLIVVTFALGLVADAFPKHWEHAIVETHKVIGLAILALVLARILWRLSHKPHPLEGISGFGRKAAFLGHLALYLLMFGAPTIGLGYAILRGQGLDFGLPSLPALMPADRARARPVREVHELAAYALIALAALHALAALWHHRIRKDGVLRRMLPGA